MRTVQTKSVTKQGNSQKTVTKTITYMKVGDLIGTAKTSYDLVKTLRRKKNVIGKTLKQYGVQYINNLLTPLIALVTGMDVYKTIMSVIEIATPIAKTIARGSGIWASWGNAADIASILLSTISRIIVQIATIFLLKMKEMIWNFEFKIREISNQTVIEMIARATRDTVEQCKEKVDKAINKTPGSDVIGYNINNSEKTIKKDELIEVEKQGDTLYSGDLVIYYSDDNEGIKYYDTEWHQTNIIDGSFQPCKNNLNNVLFAFSYEGKSGVSNQYGVVYSIDNGKNWSFLKSDNYSYYVYDAAIFENNINFSQYTDTYSYTKKQGTLNEYSILSIISDGVENKKIYYSEDLEEYYIYDSSNNLQQINGYVISNKTGRLIKPGKIISCTISVNDGNITIGEFEDELTEDGEKVEELMGNDIKYYGDTSCILEDNFLYDGEFSVNTSITANLEVI